MPWSSGDSLNSKNLNNLGGNIFNVRGYGAVGNGSTDDTSAIQTALNAAVSNGGGIVFVPIGLYVINSELTLGTSVALIGASNQNVGSDQTNGSTIKAGSSWSGSAMISATTTLNSDIKNLRVLGGSDVTYGIYYTECKYGVLEDVCVDTFTGPGIYVKRTTSAYATTLRNVLAQNTVQAASVGTWTGAVVVEATDCYLDKVEATSSSTNVAQGGNRVGILVDGANTFVNSSIGEISETGIVVRASLCRLVNVRADLNYGDGLVLVGGKNQLMGCLSLSNGQDTTNTYDGYVVETGSAGNVFVGCVADSEYAAKKHRYGFRHTSANVNQFVGCNSYGATTSAFSSAHPSVAAWQVANYQTTMTANDVTPSVANSDALLTVANGGATAITSLDDGVIGQRVTIICGSATNAPTLADSGNFKLSAAWTPGLYDTITLQCVDGTTWAEVARSANA